MLSERCTVFAQVFPGKNAPDDPESDDMVDIDPLHAVIGDGKEEIVEGVAYNRNGDDNVFSDQAGRGAGAVGAQDIAGKEKKQGYGDGGGQSGPLPAVIGVGAV